ncbi:hypothetical protein [Methylomonas methanica]|uniref:Uncharacterized protein n=1 Tax=Methylomonas methanica (strain DSM 25384 / MC09) TaxID=857087 RepID=G0A7J3_METMM|nr:hypothetical protein [Methylomonas methanica]AEG00663.1 hypothetical protein Metme_2259 [Methylomonas methanica MC09]
MFAAIGRGLYWIILVIVFGLLQLWLNVGYFLYSAPDQVSFYSVTKDGVLLFFMLAVTMGVTIDYHLDDDKSKVGKLWKSAAFVFMPLLITAFVVGAYMMITINPDPSRKELIDLLNICSLCLVVVYAFIGKAYLFYKEENK